MTVRVMIVDDQELIRTGLQAYVSAHPELEMVGEAADGYAALDLLAGARPDVVLMDLRMPGIDGVETIRRLRELHPPDEIGVLVLTTFDQDDNVLRALRAGAQGFLGKAAGPAEIVDGILHTARGQHALSGSAVQAVVGHVTHQRRVPGDPEMRSRFDALTTREREVVDALVRGDAADDIAASFFLSPFTVKTHMNRAMTKVGARDRAQLVAFAVRAGLLP